jgi:hypothetical protein
MTERLQAAIDDAAQLPPAAQDAVAAEIESLIKNARWDALLSDPRSDDVLRRMVQEAEKEVAMPFPSPRDMGDEV